MGINNLIPLIKKVTERTSGKEKKNAIRSYQLSKFDNSNWSVAVDASLMIYKTVIAMRSTGKDLKNCQGEITSHLNGILYKIIVFLEHSIIPIFVFDGKAPDIKNVTLASREAVKKSAEKKLENLSDSEDEEYIKNFKRVFRPTKENIEELKIMLDLIGIPYITAPGEADVLCSWLTMRKNEKGRRYCKGVCSDDSDMLAFGSPYLFRNMSDFLSKGKSIEIVGLSKVLKEMDFTYEQFIDLCGKRALGVVRV